MPILGLAVEFVLVAIVGIGGLIGLWLTFDQIDYLRRGYRVRRTSGDNWLYEERVSNRTMRSLPFVRTIIGEGYPAASEVRIPSETYWESEAPHWARGRRAEIGGRIAECFGADRGARIVFVDD